LFIGSLAFFDRDTMGLRARNHPAQAKRRLEWATPTFS
jgi:hypothetical protein